MIPACLSLSLLLFVSRRTKTGAAEAEAGAVVAAVGL